MKRILLFLLLFAVCPLQLFPQKSPQHALRFDGVYFTKPRSLAGTWYVTCVRFYEDKTVIKTAEVYPEKGFDMSRFETYFSKNNHEQETERGTYFFRNDSLIFSTVCHFSGETKRHAINSHYRGIKVSADTLWLQGENQYSLKKDTSRFYFRAFKKAKQK